MIRKSKVLIIVDVLKDINAGAERQIYELLKGFDHTRFDFSLVVIHQVEIPQEILEIGILVKCLNVKRIYDFSGVAKGFCFLNFIRKKQFDIVMTYHFSADIWGTFFSHLAGISNIISNRRDEGFWRRKIHKVAYKLINPWVRRIIVVSQGVKDKVIREEGVRPEKIEVIYNGVDLLRFNETPISQALRKELGVPADSILIISVGNLNPIKGHKYLIEAFAHITKDFPEAYLLLVGDGQLRSMLEFKIREKRLSSKVFLLGKRKDVPNLLLGANICILPSLSEGLSNSLLEYMAAGKPIIATRVGGNSELIKEGKEGLLVEPADSIALSSAMAKLLKDKVLSYELGSNASTKVRKHFSISAMLDKYADSFQNINSKRILHLISSGGLFGAEKVILNLVSYAGKNIHFLGAVRNIRNPHLEVIEEASGMNINTVAFDSKRQLDLSVVCRIRNFIKDNDIDIVHSHNYKSDFLSFLATRFIPVKWVATNHNWLSDDTKVRFYEFLDSLVLRFADKVIAVSGKIKETLLKSGVAEKKVVIISNGINIADFSRASSITRSSLGLGIKETDIVISIVGRLSREKGHVVFLQAAKKISDVIPNSRFLIVGDGPLIDELRQLSHCLGLNGRVVFAGFRRDVSAIYSISDMMVISSYIEGLPNNMLEAMAAKVPVVATNVGAIPEVIRNKESGLLVEKGNVEELVSAASLLISEPSLRNRLTDNAFAVVRDNFSSAVMVAGYDNIYNSLR